MSRPAVGEVFRFRSPADRARYGALARVAGVSESIGARPWCRVTTHVDLVTSVATRIQWPLGQFNRRLARVAPVPPELPAGRLSVAVSIVARAARELDEALEDPLGRGSDCEGLIARAHHARLQVALAELGYRDVDEVLDEAALRTSVRWVHFSGLEAGA